ncbi:hypothetical protein ACFLQ2_00465 [archaeon]
MFEVALGGIAFTITLAHLLVAVCLALFLVMLVKTVHFVLAKPMTAIMAAVVFVLAAMIVLELLGVFSTMDAGIASTGAMILNMVP